MISIQAQLPGDAYQLAAEHELGEPIRVYRATPIRLRTFGIMTVAFFFLVSIGPLVQSGFHIKPTDLILYGILFGTVIVAMLLAFIINRQTHNTAVYICTAGFIIREKKKIRAVRWEEIEALASNLDNTSCVIHLANKTFVRLNTNIDHFRLLRAELELKAQLGTHPEMAVEIERQCEQMQNDAFCLQQAKAKENLYQERERYLKQKPPEEAYELGEDYQLGRVLGTYRATLRSVLIPNADTGGEFIFTLCMTGGSIISLIVRPLPWNIFMIISPLLGLIISTAQIRAARNTRLHCYESGFIHIQPGSLSVIHWEQVTKTVYPRPAQLFGSLCTLHLQDNEKIEINKYFNRRGDILRILREKTPFVEVSTLQKKQRNNK